jgi:hypothetical protein
MPRSQDLPLADTNSGMSPLHTSDVTQLLAAWSEGDNSALEKLVPMVEKELHELAHRYMSREPTITRCRRRLW